MEWQGPMSKIYAVIRQWIGISVSAALAMVGAIALRHALETPQLLKSQLPGEAFLYGWRGRSIFYKVLGNMDGPAIVLLHTPEIGGSAYEMRRIVEPLAQSYRVYVPDLLGFGQSDRPSGEYSAAMYTELCKDFLRDVVGQPAILVASKLSCNYAISVAHNIPESCSALVLISPLALHGEAQQAKLLGKYVEQPLIKALLYPLVSTRLAFFLAHRCQQSGQGDFASFYANTHQLGAEHAAMALLAGKLSEDVAERFEELSQPLLLIWGTKALESPQMVARLREVAQKRRTRTLEIIQGAGLDVQRERPMEVVEAIQHWQVTQRLPAESGEETAGEGLQVESEMQAEPVGGQVSQSGGIQAYCFKCKQKREMEHPSEFTMKNGRLAVRGACAVCGSSITSIGGLG